MPCIPPSFHRHGMEPRLAAAAYLPQVLLLAPGVQAALGLAVGQRRTVAECMASSHLPRTARRNSWGDLEDRRLGNAGDRSFIRPWSRSTFCCFGWNQTSHLSALRPSLFSRIVVGACVPPILSRYTPAHVRGLHFTALLQWARMGPKFSSMEAPSLFS